jgi:hypothetical protein
MSNILPLLECLVPEINITTMRQLNQIIMAILAMTGRVTMLGISRWTANGGSYRTVCRFFHTVIPWAGVMWLFFQRHLWCQKDTYILAGDEVVISKSGEETYGIDRFYSSLFNQPILGISFLALSFISVEKRHSFPIKIEQIIKPQKKEENTDKSTEVTPQEKKKKGRPKGSKNRDKTQVVLTPELLLIKGMIISLFKLLGGLLSITYVVLDGHYGNNNALQMVRQVNLHIISKLRYNSALYIPFKPSEPNQKKGNKKYGDKINYRDIPKEYLRSSTLDEDKNIRTDIYQATLLHKEFAQELNVVILVKTNLTTLASGL